MTRPQQYRAAVFVIRFVLVASAAGVACTRTEVDGAGPVVGAGVALATPPRGGDGGASGAAGAGAAARAAEAIADTGAPPPPDDPVGHLAHPARLSAFFARLAALEAHEAKSDVRIVQLGDSHTASDYPTSVARLRLAARFGSGGRGFFGIGEPHKRQFQAGERMARSIGFEPVEAGRRPRSGAPDGLYGLTGVAMEGRAGGAVASSDLTANADHVELAFLAQGDGGSVDVRVDGKHAGRFSTRADVRASGFHTIHVARGSHVLELTLAGDGPVRLYGMRLDDDAVGTTWDALGMNGAKAPELLASDPSHVAEQLAHVAPALVVLAYGTNEAGDTTTTPAQHAGAMRALAELTKKGAPDASCLVLGPPDRAYSPPRLFAMIAAQRRAADEAGCAFYDQLAAMGGPGTMARWARETPPRARRDLVHMTRPGYAELGAALVRDLLAAYDRVRPSAASR